MGWMLLLAAIVGSGPMLFTVKPADAQAVVYRTVSVNCAITGQTVANALKRHVVGGGLLVQISGVCEENISILRDDVTLRGMTPTTTIHGPDSSSATIRMDGAKRVLIQSLTVTGGSDGINGTRGASFAVDHVAVQGAARFGIIASYNSQATIDTSTIRQCGNIGAIASNISSLVITNSTVEQNAGTGIQVNRASHLRVGQDAGGSASAKPVIVQNNTGNGISVNESAAAQIIGSTIQGNSSNGIYIARGSNADVGIGSFNFVAANTIQNNGAGSSGILVEGASSNIVGNTITGNGFGVQYLNGGSGRLGIRPDSTAYIGNSISANKLSGVGVFAGSSATIGGNNISGNGTGNIIGNRNGLNIGQSAVQIIGQNTVENHPESGIFVNMGTLALGNGFASLDSTTNVVRNNGLGTESGTTRGGILLFNGSSASIKNTALSGNGQANIWLFMAGDVDIRNATLSAPVTGSGTFVSNIEAQIRGVVRIGSGTIVETSPADAINLFSGATFELRGDTPSTIRNNTGFAINCGGGEASFEFPAGSLIFSGNNPGGGGVDISPNCSGF
jgi:hypothetical protein